MENLLDDIFDVYDSTDETTIDTVYSYDGQEELQ